jgi:hypothetical protein
MLGHERMDGALGNPGSPTPTKTGHNSPYPGAQEGMCTVPEGWGQWNRVKDDR